MRILGIMGLAIFLAAGTAVATTVNLTDGRQVQGSILKQDGKSLQMSVDGIAMTYYADEIKDVDGQPFGQAPAATPAPVTPTDNQALNPVPTEPEALPTEGGIDPEKRALILKFIDAFGTREALNSNFDALIAQIEKQKPAEAQKIRDRIKVDEIIERLLPIYDRNFSSDDLKAYIAFYGSAEGQKLRNTLPELMKESVQESIKYMQEKFPEIKGNQQ